MGPFDQDTAIAGREAAIARIAEPMGYRDYDPVEEALDPDLTNLVNEDGSLTEDAESMIHLTFQVISKAAHMNAKAKGWHDRERDFVHESMLFVTEVAEAVEEYRAGTPVHYHSVVIGEDGKLYGKPEGIGPELGDVVIRMADSAHGRGYDIGRGIVEKLRFNRTRPARHGGKLA